jgi:hypothetical protein
MTLPDQFPTPLDSIPTPDLIRDRLARLFAEARLLRGLLRLAESKNRCMAQQSRYASCQGEVKNAR